MRQRSGEPPPRAPLAYRLLLRLFPRGFRTELAPELEALLLARLAEADGAGERARVWLVAILDVLVSAPPEWRRALHPLRSVGREGSGGMEAMRQDLGYALRSLTKARGFTAVALLTLALGIGASSAVFSVVNTVLLRPLPYAEPERVVRVKAGFRGGYGDWLSQPEIVDIEEGVPALARVGSWVETSANLTGEGEPERVRAVAIMPEALALLGVQPPLGRAFVAEEGTAGSDGVALISEGLFQRRFAGDPQVVGRDIDVNGRPRTIVGVLPADFRVLSDFAQPSDLFVPMVLDRDSLLSRGNHSYHTVARLAEGATVDDARGQLEALADRLTGEGAYDVEESFGFTAVSARDEVMGGVRPALLVLMGAVGFVLLIACVNVANLMLVRGEDRQREMAVRLAVGAGRGRLVRQLLTESVLLSVAGGALGALLATAGTRVIVSLAPATLPRAQAVAVDGAVLGFTVAVAVLTGLVFGAVPALQGSRQDPNQRLREGARGQTDTKGRGGARRLLAASELAFAVVLLVGAGLMVRTFQSLSRVDTGFDASGVLSFTISLPGASYPDAAAVTGFFDRLLEQARALPGVEEAGAVRILPLTSTIGDWSIQIEGYEAQPGENPRGDWQAATPGYLEAMGIRLVEGRLLEPSDDAAGAPVVVINRTMAETYWPRGAVGRRFRAGDERPYVTIVGVVEDVSRNALVDEPRTEMIHPHAQYARALGFAPQTMTVVVRGAGGTAPPFAPFRELVRTMDPDLPVSDVRTVDEVVAATVAEERFTTALLSGFGALAVLLALVGIYGVQAYAVSRRTHEIGIRIALGAGRGRVHSLVLKDGAAVIGGGLVLGTAIALALTRLMEALLYGVEPTDPLTFALVPALLGASALLATWIPARRASGVPPTEALRAE